MAQGQTTTLLPCRACATLLSPDARRCPKCGALTPRARSRRRWIAVALAVVIVAVVAIRVRAVVLEHRRADRLIDCTRLGRTDCSR